MSAGHKKVTVDADGPRHPTTSGLTRGRQYLLMSDAELLTQCQVDTYRASGPGGQKRNKTSSAVRIRHQPTGLMVTATESRSQHENRARALRRLRQAIALTQRNPWESGNHPAFYVAAHQQDPSLHVGSRHPEYWLIIQHVLDVLAASGGAVADAAEALGVSTGQLVRFLKKDDKVWQQAGTMRAALGLPPLR